MATSIVLVTQDRYLVRGMRIFFPDIILLDSIDRNIFDNGADEYSVLIDSRSPLRLYDYLIRHPARTKKTICCVMLDMRHREENLLSMKLFMNTSLTAPDMASLFNLVLNMKGRRLTTKWLLNLRLSTHEAIAAGRDADGGGGRRAEYVGEKPLSQTDGALGTPGGGEL